MLVDMQMDTSIRDGCEKMNQKNMEVIGQRTFSDSAWEQHV